MLSPAWLFFAPRLLPLLLAIWIAGPVGPARGVLKWDVCVSTPNLNCGAWLRLLGAALTGIVRNSLPGMMASLSASEPGGNAALPPSQCTGASVESGKLVLDGLAQVSAEQSLVYKLRTGLQVGAQAAAAAAAALSLPAERRPPAIATFHLPVPAHRHSVDPLASLCSPLQHRMSDELVATEGTAFVAASSSPRSVLLWDNPEVCCDIGGDNMIGRLIPKLWLPVLSATGISLPAGVTLQRVAASSAADGIVASGVIDLEGSSGVVGFSANGPASSRGSLPPAAA